MPTMAAFEHSAASNKVLEQGKDSPHLDNIENFKKASLNTNVTSSDTEKAAEPSDISSPR